QNKIVSILPEGIAVKKDEVVVTFDSDQLQRNYDDQKVKWQQAAGKAKMAEGELTVQKSKADTDTDKARTAAKLALLDLEMYLPGDYKVAVEEAKGEIEMAKKDLQEAKDDLEHYRKLYRQGFATLETVHARETLMRRNEFVLSGK